MDGHKVGNLLAVQSRHLSDTCESIWRIDRVCYFDKFSIDKVTSINCYSRVAQGAYLDIEYIRNVLSVSGTLKYADSGTAWCQSGNIRQLF